jgi:hypothetical protein
MLTFLFTALLYPWLNLNRILGAGGRAAVTDTPPAPEATAEAVAPSVPAEAAGGEDTDFNIFADVLGAAERWRMNKTNMTTYIVTVTKRKSLKQILLQNSETCKVIQT